MIINLLYVSYLNESCIIKELLLSGDISDITFRGLLNEMIKISNQTREKSQVLSQVLE